MAYADADTAIVNRALQVIGTRTTVSTAELNALSSNEAIQANLIYAPYRDQLLRMAPWNCGVAYANLIYLTSQPGTPENQSPFTTFWTPGQPPLGWAYEYFYPDDCLRACYVIPSMITGFAGGVPIYPVPTSIGTAPTIYQGPAIKFKVQVDQYFRQASSFGAAPGGSGSGYAVGDTIICGGDPTNAGSPGAIPAGLVQVVVTQILGGGVVNGISLQPFPNSGQSSFMFSLPSYNLPQISTSGTGTGFVLVVNGFATGAAHPGRVILTNQEFATLAYVKQLTSTGVMDPDFVEAWVTVLGGGLAQALTGDKELANSKIMLANARIMEARKTDGNEGLTVNDVTPDFIRIRGVDFSPYFNGTWNGFDWGPDWPLF